MKPTSPRGWQGTVPEGDDPSAPRNADPQATQKISKAELDAVLKRTKSGTRKAIRGDEATPESSGARPLPTVPREFPITALPEAAFPGPRDDSPEVSIMRIDSVEIAAIDPSALPAPLEQPHAPAPASAAMPVAPASFVPVTPSSASPLLAAIPTPNARPGRVAQMQRPLPKRRSALEWCGIVLAVAAAMVASFFAGRFTVRLH